jgi:hypothetical protein
MLNKRIGTSAIFKMGGHGTKKQGPPQLCNFKESNSADNLNGLGSRFFQQTPDKSPACETLSKKIQLSLPRILTSELSINNCF